MGKWEFSQAGKMMLWLSLSGEQIMAPSRERQSYLYCSVDDYLEFAQPQPDKLANLCQISNKKKICIYFLCPSSGCFFLVSAVN